MPKVCSKIQNETADASIPYNPSPLPQSAFWYPLPLKSANAVYGQPLNNYLPTKPKKVLATDAVIKVNFRVGTTVFHINQTCEHGAKEI